FRVLVPYWIRRRRQAQVIRSFSRRKCAGGRIMKVVTQMIHHFWERGALSAEQVKHLVRHGFVQAEDLAGFNGRAASEAQATEFELELDAIAENLTRSATKRRGGKSRKRGRVVSLSGLGDRIRYEFDRRADWWPAVIELAREFGPCE